MPSDFKVYAAAHVKDAGTAVAVVATIQPSGLNYYRVEWYLFVLSNPYTVGFDATGDITTTIDAAEVVDPVEGALGLIKSAFMNYQTNLQVATGKPVAPQEIEFVETERKLLNRIWFRDAGHEEIVKAKAATKCVPLKEFLVAVSGGPVHKRSKESPYPEEFMKDPESGN